MNVDEVLAGTDPCQKGKLVRDAYAGRLLPGEQIATFSRIEQLFPSRTISRGSSSRELLRSPLNLRDVRFESGGCSFDIYDWFSRNRVAGAMVLYQGRCVLEHYEYGLSPSTRWMSMSMAKSISTTLVGIAIREGAITSVDDLLTKYLPELAGGAYGDVTIRQLMLMCSGVQWSEVHTTELSERRAVLELQIAQKPGAILDYMSSLPKLAPAGTRWNYSTGETHLVGVLLKAATGEWPSDYLSSRLWTRLGMDSDASWWLESPDGLEIAGSGIAATLRDYARFGQFICEGGHIGGDQVLPDNWIRDAGGPSAANGERIPYGYMWWPVSGADGSYDDGAFSARGIFGQRLYINPRREVVVAQWSARSKPMGDEPIVDNDFFNAVCSYLERESRQERQG